MWEHTFNVRIGYVNSRQATKRAVDRHTRKKLLLYAINTYHCLVTFMVLCLLSEVDIFCNEDGMLGKVEREQEII